MRFSRIARASALALLVTVNGVAWAGSPVNISLPEQVNIITPTVGATKVLDRATGEVKVIDEKSQSLKVVASAWPTLPAGAQLTEPPRTRDTSLGGMVAYGITETTSGGSKSVYISILGSSSWSAWQQLPLGDGFINWVNVSPLEQSGSTLATIVMANYGDDHMRTIVASNASGAWNTRVIADSAGAVYDSLYPNDQVTVSGRLNGGSASIWYTVPSSNGWAPIEISNGKMALFGSATFAVTPFTSGGNTQNAKSVEFTQLIDVSTLAPVKRTVRGAEHAVPGDGMDTAEGSYNIYVETSWWNKAETDVNIVMSRVEAIDCPATPDGLNPFFFQSGSCTYDYSMVQAIDTTLTTLASVRAIQGKNVWFDFVVAETDSGLVGLVYANYRDISVNNNGEFTGYANDKRWATHAWVVPNSDKVFSPITLSFTESTSTSDRDTHYLHLFQGVAIDINQQCQANGGSNPSCKLAIGAWGEGKTQTFSNLATGTGTGVNWSEFDVARSASELSLVTSNWTFGDFWAVGTKFTLGAFTVPATKSAATLAKVASSLKVKKSLNLPLLSGQKHDVSWSVAKASSKICSLTTTKTNGVVTKVSVKGLAAGKCSLTAKTTKGFFYKTLNKSVSITITK